MISLNQIICVICSDVSEILDNVLKNNLEIEQMNQMFLRNTTIIDYTRIKDEHFILYY